MCLTTRGSHAGEFSGISRENPGLHHNAGDIYSCTIVSTVSELQRFCKVLSRLKVCLHWDGFSTEYREDPLFRRSSLAQTSHCLEPLGIRTGRNGAHASNHGSG